MRIPSEVVNTVIYQHNHDALRAQLHVTASTWYKRQAALPLVAGDITNYGGPASTLFK